MCNMKTFQDFFLSIRHSEDALHLFAYFIPVLVRRKINGENMMGIGKIRLPRNYTESLVA